MASGARARPEAASWPLKASASSSLSLVQRLLATDLDRVELVALERESSEPGGEEDSAEQRPAEERSVVKPVDTVFSRQAASQVCSPSSKSSRQFRNSLTSCSGNLIVAAEEASEDQQSLNCLTVWTPLHGSCPTTSSTLHKHFHNSSTTVRGSSTVPPRGERAGEHWSQHGGSGSAGGGLLESGKAGNDWLQPCRHFLSISTVIASRSSSM